MKTCFKCGCAKDLSEYYAHKRMGDGHLNKCKDCTKRDTKERFVVKAESAEWVESERGRHRDNSKFPAVARLGRMVGGWQLGTLFAA